MRRVFLLACCVAISAVRCKAQANTDVYKVTSPVQTLGEQLGKSFSLEPYKSGMIKPEDAPGILRSLGAVTDKPTIIHLLRWKDSSHTTVSFQKWYFYDPTPPKGALYLQSKQQVFQTTATPGYKEFQLVYIHLNAVLEDGPKEWAQLVPIPSGTIVPSQSLTGGTLSTGTTVYLKITAVSSFGESVPSTETSVELNKSCDSGASCSVTVEMPPFCTTPAPGITGCTVYSSASSGTEKRQPASSACVNTTSDSCLVKTLGVGASPPSTVQPTLIHPVNYTITVTKAQTQFIQDVKTALQILGLTVAAPAGTVRPQTASLNPGYFAITTFESQWSTSGITIAASLDASNKNQGSGQNSTSNSLSSSTYTNEKPSWIGLSAGVQVTSYKDLTFQSSSGTLVPNSITKQGVYFFLDGYYPRVLPSLASFRYVPHPFFGLPIQGKVLRHSMLGVGVGFHWLEPFGGVIFDTENNQVKGGGVSKTGLTYRYVFGVKLSMSAVAKALKTK